MDACRKPLPQTWRSDDQLLSYNLNRANLANKRPGSRVHRHVSRQVVMCVEDFSTVWTRVGLVLALHHLKDQNHSLVAIGHFDLFDLKTHWLNFGVQGEANSCSSSSCRDPSIWRPIPKGNQIANRLRSFVQLYCMRLQLVWHEMRMQRIKI